MPMLTGSKKARLRQPPGPVAYPRDGAANFLRSVVKSWQGKAVVLGSEEVRRPYYAVSGTNGIQSTGLISWIVKTKGVLPVLN